MNKGIIDLIPAAVEAVKQENAKKMQLFGSVGKAEKKLVQNLTLSSEELRKITELAAAEIKNTYKHDKGGLKAFCDQTATF